MRAQICLALLLTACGPKPPPPSPAAAEGDPRS